MALDRDSASNALRLLCEVGISIVHRALEVRQSEDAVAVTGQPGIGKMRRSMM